MSNGRSQVGHFMTALLKGYLLFHVCLLAELHKANGAHDVFAVQYYWIVDFVVAVATNVHGQFFIISFE